MAVPASIILMLCFAAAGCRNDYRLVKVSGTVTLHGKPIGGIEVRFQPMASEGHPNPGPGSAGVTGPDGRYTLMVQDASLRPGAVVGTHMVFLSTAQPPPDPKNDTAPAPSLRYRWESFVVPSRGLDNADFALTLE